MTTLEQTLGNLAKAQASGGTTRAGLRAARQVAIEHCRAALRIEPSAAPSLGEVLRLALSAPATAARRACAVLLVHALAVPGLIPPASSGDVCALTESALRDVLLRAAYPFDGTIEAKMRVLERLHTTLDDLLQPLEPTFPNFQGLYAG